MPQPAQLTSCFSPRDPKPPRCLHPSMSAEVAPPSLGTWLTSGLLIYSRVSARRMGFCLHPLSSRQQRAEAVAGPGSRLWGAQ